MSGPLTERSFASFPELGPDTVAFLKERGFEYATPVQAAVVPLFCGNKDVVVDACTGSGKTLAFLLPVVEKLRSCGKKFSKHDVAFVVISPTRELATQTFKVAQPLFQHLTALSVTRLVGGSEVAGDLKDIQETGGNVIIATPGRLNDIIKKKTSLHFPSVEVLVLDEADRLLDLGFETQLLEIIHSLPKQRRTGLFSATQTEACEMLVKAGLRNPLRVNVTTTTTCTSQKVTDFSQKTPQSLSITALVLPLDEKWNHFVQFLQEHSDDKIIVYGLTCACIDYWFYVLRKMERVRSLKIRALHGKMPQSGREKAMEAFASDSSGVLLATDVAARGLDIPEVHWVLQLDAPQDPNAFVHRVGRTARMGRRGEARIYLAPKEESYIKFLQLRKIPVKKEEAVVEGTDAVGWLRTLSESDREAMMKGITAFTSYIRAYSNHHCPYIFHLKELDLGRLAYVFGLLYLPGMKEIKVKEGVDFLPSKVDPHSISFVDKAREAERQKRLQQVQEERREKARWKVNRKGKKGKKTVEVEEAVEKPKKSQNPNKRDLEELEEDYKSYRLEKKGKRKEKCDPCLIATPPDDLPEAYLPPQEQQLPAPASDPTPPRKKQRHEKRDSQERDALRLSLRMKLESLKQERQIRGRR